MNLESWIESFFKTRILEIEKIISFGETKESDLYLAVFETEDEDILVVANFNISINQENKIVLKNVCVC